MTQYSPERPLLLVSEGKKLDANGHPIPARDRFSWHTFVRTQIDPDPDLGDLSPQLTRIYSCDETGVERKLGADRTRPDLADADDDRELLKSLPESKL